MFLFSQTIQHKILRHRIILIHYSDVIWMLRRLKWPTTRLSVHAEINGNVTAPHYWPFVRRTSGNQWLSSQKIRNAGCVSMAWRHHGSDLYLEKRTWHPTPFGLHIPLSLSIFHVTHWDWDRMVDILQRSISNTFLFKIYFSEHGANMWSLCHNFLVLWNKHLIRLIFASLIIYFTSQKMSLWFPLVVHEIQVWGIFCNHKAWFKLYRNGTWDRVSIIQHISFESRMFNESHYIGVCYRYT